MGAVKPRSKKGAAFEPPPIDPDEEAAFERACFKLKEFFPGHPSPDVVVYAVISAWIVERVRRSMSRKICGEFAFGLGDAHLRGSLEAVLPQIAEQLSDLPSDKPFFDLSRDQVIDILSIGYHAGRHTGASFDDPVPI